MNILLCGASGFIGGEIRQALTRAGHHVVPTRSGSGQGQGRTVDFTRALRPQDWRDALEGIDAVVNAVGLFRDTPAKPLSLVHEKAPMALFDACAQAQVRRVVQISALGVDAGNTAYARTKRAADQHLLHLAAQGHLNATIVRPSIVFGLGGASSELFMNLARSPLLTLPRPLVRTRIQPVAACELAAAVAHLMSGPSGHPAVLPAVGPRALTIAAFIAELRAQLGHGPAQVLSLPDWATRWSARVGDHVPASPWCSDTLALLTQDNTADPAAFEAVLGRPATSPDRLVEVAWR